MSGIRPFVLGISGLKLTEAERDLFGAVPPAGIILFLRNVDNPKQLLALNESIKEISNGLTRIFLDQEGGRVQRLAPPHWQRFPMGRDFDALEGEALSNAIYAQHRLIGDDMAQMGFDVNCAPCLDLRSDFTAEFLRDRSFGGNVDRLVGVALQAQKGLQDAGILPVAKHIPGHGRGQVDSHLEMPQVLFDRDPYGARLPDDVEIFKRIADYPFGMSAHILYSQIDPEFALTLSPKGFDYIRNIVGFKGVMLSDDLAMKALNGTQGELTTKTLAAGADLALSCSGKIEEITEIYATDHMASPALVARLSALYASVSNAQKLSPSERKSLEKHLPKLCQNNE